MTDSNIAGIAEADFGKAGVSFDNDRPILVDSSDFLFYAAFAMLPIDGTVAGPYMPFWTPLSPWLFMAYAVANWRLLPQVWHRFRAFFLFPVLLIALSAVDWCLVAFHRLPALVSLAGVVQRLSIMFDWTSVKNFFIHLMSRQYISSTSHWGGGRPQFLFAEPSYIGMHLFGVLLPLIWLVRGRDHKRANQLRVLIMVFAAGSVLMGAGVRIILDSIIALVFVIIEMNSWHTWRGRLVAFGELVVTVGLGACSVAVNHRLSSIAELGFDGDGSFYARLWQSLGPGAGALKHPKQLLLGYGAGNLSDATHQGADAAVRSLERLGLNASAPKGWYAQVTPANMFTMSAYTSFFVEFGLIASVILVVLVLWWISHNHAWNKTTVCWLLLTIYLYVQFEGYAFYALPLLLWAVAAVPRLKSK